MRVNDRLYNRIKERIYHSTSISGYCGIRSSGAILPNAGSFPFSHGVSAHSCCYRLGAIALLDLRNPSLPLVGTGACLNWTTFLNNHSPITILLDIDPACLTERLHDYHSLQQRFPCAPMVAEAEKCYTAPIAVDAIRRCVLVSSKWRNLFRIIPGHEITDADFSRTEASFERQLRRIKWKHPFAWEQITVTILPKAP